jgi:hypothetical protein
MGCITMTKPYLILVDNKLWTKTLTFNKAKQIVNELLTMKGLQARIAYEIKDNVHEKEILK